MKNRGFCAYGGATQRRLVLGAGTSCRAWRGYANVFVVLAVCALVALAAGCGGGGGGGGDEGGVLGGGADWTPDPLPASSGSVLAPTVDDTSYVTPVDPQGSFQADLHCTDPDANIRSVLVEVSGVQGYHRFSVSGGGSGTASVRASLRPDFPRGIVDIVVACEDSDNHVSNHVPITMVVDDLGADVGIRAVAGAAPPDVSGDRMIHVRVLESDAQELVGEELDNFLTITQHGTSATVSDASGNYAASVVGHGDEFTMIIDQRVDLRPSTGLDCRADMFQTFGGALEHGRISGTGNTVFSNISGRDCGQVILANQLTVFEER